MAGQDLGKAARPAALAMIVPPLAGWIELGASKLERKAIPARPGLVVSILARHSLNSSASSSCLASVRAHRARQNGIKFGRKPKPTSYQRREALERQRTEPAIADHEVACTG
jgi:hypothetical protein